MDITKILRWWRATWLSNFYPIWIIIIALGVAAFFAWNNIWEIAQWIAWISMGLFVLFMLSMPMNLVYGLIGTKGNIRVYVFLLILINFIFSLIYYSTTFKDAGVTYDINQPYISFGMFTGKDKDVETCSIQIRDTSYIYDVDGNKISYAVSEETHNYQRVDFMYVLKNTFMTSLMQEPSDFFAIASTYNRAVDEREKDILGYKDSCKPICCCKDCNCRKEFGEVVIDPKHNRDQQKSELFHWLLILQVFISWIFFGVFISILYNKFRYES